MKKILALLLALIMVVSMVACGKTAPTAPDAEASQPEASRPEASQPEAQQGGTSVDAGGKVTTEYNAPDEVTTDKELPPFKILVIYAQFTDKLGSQYKAALEYLAAPLNVEFTFLETGFGGDEAMTAIQAALMNDYDGCIGVGTDEATVKQFDEAGVPYIVQGGCPTPEMAPVLAGYNNYLGAVVVDDYLAAWNMAESLYNQGCRNVGWFGLNRGMSPQHDQRTAGFLDAVASHDDMNLVNETYDYTAADAVAIAAATYPELDGYGYTFLSEAAYNLLETEGLVGSLKIAGIDISESTGKYVENGTIAYVAGGNYATIQIAFAVLYNYLLDGTKMIENPAENLEMLNIDIHNIEEFNNYIKYLDSGVPAYTPQEILDMTHYQNSDMDAAALKEICQSYTLEDVMTRHADLLVE